MSFKKNDGSSFDTPTDVSINDTFLITQNGITKEASILQIPADDLLTPTGVVAGTYGNGLNVPVITVDAEGRVTSATTLAVGVTSIDTLTNVSVGFVTSNQVLAYSSVSSEWHPFTLGAMAYAGNASAGTLDPSGVTIGVYGCVERIPQITVDQYGRITFAQTVHSLSITGVSAGTYGAANMVPQFTVNAYGRITAATAVSVVGGGGTSGGTIAHLDDILDVSVPSPTNGQVLTWRTNNWVASSPFITEASVCVILNSYLTSSSALTLLIPYLTSASAETRYSHQAFSKVSASNTTVSASSNSQILSLRGDAPYIGTSASGDSVKIKFLASSTFLTSSSAVTLLVPYLTSASAVTLIAPFLTSSSALTLLIPYATSASVISLLVPYLTSASAESRYETRGFGAVSTDNSLVCASGLNQTLNLRGGTGIKTSASGNTVVVKTSSAGGSTLITFPVIRSIEKLELGSSANATVVGRPFAVLPYADRNYTVTKVMITNGEVIGGEGLVNYTCTFQTMTNTYSTTTQLFGTTYRASNGGFNIFTPSVSNVISSGLGLYVTITSGMGAGAGLIPFSFNVQLILQG